MSTKRKTEKESVEVGHDQTMEPKPTSHRQKFQNKDFITKLKSLLTEEIHKQSDKTRPDNGNGMNKAQEKERCSLIYIHTIRQGHRWKQSEWRQVIPKRGKQTKEKGKN